MSGFEELSVIITASPIRSHPSTHMISTVIDSLARLGITENVPLILAHDGLPPGSTSEIRKRYEEYLAILANLIKDRPKAQITILDEWGQLTASLRKAMNCVATKYVLICQHDLVFTKKVNFQQALQVLRTTPKVRHIRFNLQHNRPYSFDTHPRTRLKSYREERFGVDNNMISLVRTIGWSDNNHLTTRGYYDEIVFPMVGTRKVAPEHVMNLAATKRTHRFTGTYLWDGLGAEPYLLHLDGKEGTTVGYKLQQPVRLDTLPGKVRNWWIRIVVNFNRIRYVIKIYVIGMQSHRKNSKLASL